ncbi:hypothetical protein, partial [Belliella aquatica]|uniref:hypothetical protein n=1 Tax=Belliella aquatica TaxID=1323734 RepID=UPI001E3A20B8
SLTRRFRLHSRRLSGDRCAEDEDALQSTSQPEASASGRSEQQRFRYGHGPRQKQEHVLCFRPRCSNTNGEGSDQT